MPEENDAQGNNNGASGNNSGFDQDAFFKRFGDEFAKFQQQGQQQGQQSGAQGNNSGAASNDQVLSAIQALPEQFANVIKEMNPGGADGNNDGKYAGSNGEQEKQDEHTPGKPKSWAELWFGKGQA